MIETDELRYALDLGALTPSETVAISELEAHAVAFVERQTRRYFGPTIAHTEYLEGRGHNTLFLKEELVSITQVRERAHVGDDWTAVTDFTLRGSRLIRNGGSVWPNGYDIEVVYDFGYAAGQEPGDIRRLVIDLVKLKWEERAADSAVVAETVGPESVRYDFDRDETSLAMVEDTLVAWCLPRMA